MTTISDINLKLKWLFNLYDLNHDGFVSKNELVKILTAMDELIGDSCRHPSYFEEIFEQADLNQDGQINLIEFVQLGKNNKILFKFFELFDNV